MLNQVLTIVHCPASNAHSLSQRIKKSDYIYRRGKQKKCETGPRKFDTISDTYTYNFSLLHRGWVKDM
jgi:hypothetical protein